MFIRWFGASSSARESIFLKNFIFRGYIFLIYLKYFENNEFILLNFKKIEIYKEQNYESIIASFEIEDEKKNIITLNPEIRIYNQPAIFTSEADIKSSIFTDKFLVMSLLKGEDYFNVRYQNKPFMLWIWISISLVAFGGLISFVKKIK